jgi:hypothetical protein
MEAQRALKKADAWVAASLGWLDKPDGADEPTREDSPTSAALLTLNSAAQRLRHPRVNTVRLEMKIFELAECFDIAREIVGNA